MSAPSARHAGIPAGMVDVQVGAEHVIHLLVGDAEREQLVAPARLTGKIERRRMALVFACAGIDQNGVARRADDKGLIGDHHRAQACVEHLGLRAGEVMPEHRLIVSREEILRPSPRPLALDDSVDGNVADPELLHGWFAPHFLRSVAASHNLHKSSAARLAMRPCIASQKCC